MGATTISLGYTALCPRLYGVEEQPCNPRPRQGMTKDFSQVSGMHVSKGRLGVRGRWDWAGGGRGIQY